ncbi:hypothetical protein EZV62_027649 [Acer yangbiense]|uniref:Uncharacterized protein n=1 Tax=Acer yangbiense TaxID=1000413 RepID=A0A5C7GUY5_9ROSI|nr:hypothetical protein EZV62_027649 [Acer yangbiense]
MKVLHSTIFSLVFLCFLFNLPLFVSAVGECETESRNKDNGKNRALKFKTGGILSILIASGIGVSLPILGKRVSAFDPENNLFFLIKAFAAGVILSTGFVHILPDAFDSLNSPCLSSRPWNDFPFTGFVAMVSAILTMMIDCFATSFYQRSHFNKALPVDEEMSGGHEGHVHVHTHATHGHAHGSAFVAENSAQSDLFRHRVVSQVLELGIVVHSVIIGISLGASQSAKTVKPLVAALTFHQFFEGMGLGGCISQGKEFVAHTSSVVIVKHEFRAESLHAKFKSRAIVVMVLFFSLTSPIGIGIGIGISRVYDENSSTALIVEGILNSASAGILIYMALVDLLAADFMNPRMQSNFKLQIGANFALLLGSGSMSLLARWA